MEVAAGVDVALMCLPSQQAAAAARADDDDFADVVLRLVPSGTDVRAHRVILSRLSPVLSAMFRFYSSADATQRTQSSDGLPIVRVELEPETAPYFQTVIRYLYGARIALTPVNVVHLLALADLLMIHPLQSQCLTYISTVVHSDVAALLRVFSAACTLNISVVKDICLSCALDLRSGWKLLAALQAGAASEPHTTLPPQAWAEIFVHKARALLRAMREQDFSPVGPATPSHADRSSPTAAGRSRSQLPGEEGEAHVGVAAAVVAAAVARSVASDDVFGTQLRGIAAVGGLRASGDDDDEQPIGSAATVDDSLRGFRAGFSSLMRTSATVRGLRGPSSGGTGSTSSVGGTVGGEELWLAAVEAEADKANRRLLRNLKLASPDYVDASDDRDGARRTTIPMAMPLVRPPLTISRSQAAAAASVDTSKLREELSTLLLRVIFAFYRAALASPAGAEQFTALCGCLVPLWELAATAPLISSSALWAVFCLLGSKAANDAFVHLLLAPIAASFGSGRLKEVLRRYLLIPREGAAHVLRDVEFPIGSADDSAALKDICERFMLQNQPKVLSLIGRILSQDSLQVQHEDELVSWALDCIVDLHWTLATRSCDPADAAEAAAALPSAWLRSASALLWRSIRWEYSSDAALEASIAAVNVLANSIKHPGPSRSGVAGLLSTSGVVIPVSEPAIDIKDALASLGIPIERINEARERHRMAGLVASPGAAAAMGLQAPRILYASRMRPLLADMEANAPTNDAVRQIQQQPVLAVHITQVDDGDGGDLLHTAPPSPSSIHTNITFGRHMITVESAAPLLLTDRPTRLRLGMEPHRDDEPTRALLPPSIRTATLQRQPTTAATHLPARTPFVGAVNMRDIDGEQAAAAVAAAMAPLQLDEAPKR